MDNRELVDKLEKLFSELLNLIEQYGKGEIDYQISEVKYVVNLLRENINNEYSNSEDIINEIKIIRKNLYPARGGLSEFFIWKNDVKERIKVNEPLSRVGDEIWNLLK
ncbi:hypothetical protein [Rummeliibacillus pycnus]|uniref:hypothetical protein n=1 Tax=Rummeliibacillus pycnus TaxID=101070 RepID=UPI000C99D057|nr:hypothetical protein [Rummeliibacillus pycnus]